MSTTNLHKLTLGDLAESLARVHCDGVALVDGERRVTFRQLSTNATKLANGIRARGWESGDRVLWLGLNSARFFEVLFAVAKLGGVLCPANWRQSTSELEFILRDWDPSLVFFDENLVDSDLLRGAGPGSARWYSIGGEASGSCHQLMTSSSDEDEFADVAEDAAAIGIYTAAFDGRPACALLSHRALLTQDVLVAQAYELSSKEVLLAAGPLFHIASLGLALANLHVGGRVVVLPKMVPDDMCAAIERHGCTRAYLPRALIPQLVEANRQASYDLRSLRTPSISPEWDALVQVDRRPGAGVQGYGQTELTGLVTFAMLSGDTIGPFGRPSPLATVRVFDESGNDVEEGGVGEMVVRGPTVMLGYWNRPEINAERQRDGWHHTNDLVRREVDGSFTFIGPKGCLIKSGGENIYPAEVEAALGSHPAVAEVSVVGIDDPRWGQAVQAFVVIRAGAAATEQELIDVCRARMASYKKPRLIIFVDRLPAG